MGCWSLENCCQNYDKDKKVEWQAFMKTQRRLKSKLYMEFLNYLGWANFLSIEAKNTCQTNAAILRQKLLIGTMAVPQW